MAPDPNVEKLARRVAKAAEAAGAARSVVSAIDVFEGIGWLSPSNVDRWRQGRSRTWSGWSR